MGLNSLGIHHFIFLLTTLMLLTSCAMIACGAFSTFFILLPLCFGLTLTTGAPPLDWER